MLCYLNPKENFFIIGWNLDKDGNLWVTKQNGGNKRIALKEEGALGLYNELCYMASIQFPCLIHDGEKFKNNLITEGE